MCGIFGIAVRPATTLPTPFLRKLRDRLFVLSESRAMESAGLHLYLPGSCRSRALKGAQPVSELLKTGAFRQTLQAGLDLIYTAGDKAPTEPLIAIACSHLVSNGSAELAQNNQPVRWGPVTMVHNGIVVNVDHPCRQNPLLQRNAEVDTEVMAALLADAMASDLDPVAASSRVFAAMRGAASAAWVDGEAATLALATNTGDLHYAMLPGDARLVFAPEKFILDSAIKPAARDAHGSAGWSGSEALEAIRTENRPRTASLRWDLVTAGLAFNDTIGRVNELDKIGWHK